MVRNQFLTLKNEKNYKNCSYKMDNFAFKNFNFLLKIAFFIKKKKVINRIESEIYGVFGEQ